MVCCRENFTFTLLCEVGTIGAVPTTKLLVATACRIRINVLLNWWGGGVYLVGSIGGGRRTGSVAWTIGE
jgi:hypothetical protein